MFARTPVTVAASSYLVVEAAVDFVLLRAKDRGEIICHSVTLTFLLFSGRDYLTALSLKYKS